MKKILALLLTLAMLLSFATVSFASEKVLNPASAELRSDGAVSISESGAALSKNGYIGFKNVDLSGIKSVKIEAACQMPYGSNGDAVAIRLDSPKARAIGYVVINDDIKTEFFGDIEPCTGVHDVYFTSTYMYESYYYVKMKSITLLSEQAPVSDEVVSVPDSAIIDNFSDTWAATDDLGRKVADFEETGPVKEGDHFVGIMYWDWHDVLTSTPYVIPEIYAKKPEAKEVYSDPVWDTNGVYYWGEPLLGFYTSYDYFVYRKHAQWLANAGVDAIFYDYTNGTSAYIKPLRVLMQAFRDAKASGIDIPGISAYTGGPQNLNDMAEALWFNLYADENNHDIVFKWQGKPFIICNSEATVSSYLDTTDAAQLENMEKFYAMVERRGGGNREKGQTDSQNPTWIWLENYPLHEWGAAREDGRVEAMTLGVAINHSYVYGYRAVGLASDPYTKGRGYTEGFGEDYTPGNARSAAFMREQASQILDTDPAFVYVDGWNEWTAIRQQEYAGFKNSFVDACDYENSRDLEPNRGPLKDDYYNLLCDFVRKYKGVRSAPTASAEVTIDVSGDASQWADVAPEFINDYDAYERDADKRGGGKYVSQVINSISRAKVARDKDNFYFYVKCLDAIKEEGTEFMHLYINIDRNRATGWEGYDFAIGRLKGKIEKFDGSWSVIGDVNYIIKGDTLTLSVPRCLMGETETVDFEFKWVDNAGEIAANEFLELYVRGSVAPMGRFNYLYTEKKQTALSESEREALYGTAIFKKDSNRMIVSGGKMNVYEPDIRKTAIEMNGTLYVPSDAVMEFMYGESKFEYDANDNTVRLQSFDLKGREIADHRLTYTTLGSMEAKVNGKAVVLSAPVIVKDGMFYVPLTYLSDCLGFELWTDGEIYAVSRYGKVDSSLVLSVKDHLN